MEILKCLKKIIQLSSLKLPNPAAAYEEYQNSFVEVFSDNQIIVELQYPRLQMQNAEQCYFLRKDTFEKLKMAVDTLPQNYKFKILDAWRPFLLQKELYDKYKTQIIREYDLENTIFDEQEKLVSSFVSLLIVN